MAVGKYQRVAQVASAMAVVVSLVFVGLEVRETARQTRLNTEALHIAAYQDLVAQIAQFNEALLDPALAELYSKLNSPENTWDDLTPLESVQAERILFMVVRHADMAYYQYERGLLPEDRLTSAVAPLVSPLRAPIYQEFWNRRKGAFVESFRSYIDARAPGA
jgi:hypothetical protein